MSKPDKQQETKAPGHFANEGRPPRETRKPDAEEQHQRRKDQAPRGEDADQTPRGEDAESERSKQKERLSEVLR